jgi:hypothetical protein
MRHVLFTPTIPEIALSIGSSEPATDGAMGTIAAGMIQRDLPNPQLGFLRLIEPFGGDADLIGSEGHAGPAKKGMPGYD